MNPEAKQTLGLIGFGQFGWLAARHLAGCYAVTVTDREGRAAEAAALGATWGTLAEAAASDIVIVAVPVAAMRETFAAIAPHIKPGALVLDVASVKVLPVQ